MNTDVISPKNQLYNWNELQVQGICHWISFVIVMIVRIIQHQNWRIFLNGGQLFSPIQRQILMKRYQIGPFVRLELVLSKINMSFGVLSCWLWIVGGGMKIYIITCSTRNKKKTFSSYRKMILVDPLSTLKYLSSCLFTLGFISSSSRKVEGQFFFLFFSFFFWMIWFSVMIWTFWSTPWHL